MPEIICGLTECSHNEDMRCNCKTVEIDENGCNEYDDITAGPGYREIYYAAIATEIDGEKIKCRLEKRGRKVEWNGLTLYTGQDIRQGIEEAFFTEKRTGVLFPLAKMQTDSNLADRLMEDLAKLPDVMTFPLYEELPGGKLVRKEE